MSKIRFSTPLPEVVTLSTVVGGGLGLLIAWLQNHELNGLAAYGTIGAVSGGALGTLGVPRVSSRSSDGPIATEVAWSRPPRRPSWIGGSRCRPAARSSNLWTQHRIRR